MRASRPTIREWLIKPAKGDGTMNAAVLNDREEEGQMTDFQFKAIMAMVLEILDKNDIEEAKKTIAKLAGDLAKDADKQS